MYQQNYCWRFEAPGTRSDDALYCGYYRIKSPSMSQILFEPFYSKLKCKIITMYNFHVITPMDGFSLLYEGGLYEIWQWL